ncbi:hypothetical protein F4820DRAFT_442232 [Hypoxylon rubiginosum]|uniref:Uncharacterized protein n=1 Tax=Hypoxylon rubiginosum TaxID=110542 RepID=A0ACB9YGC3_9PEZI|nr:hypothetical protein F4820DRAFT_442232 [Hypoxylon rubiginosum]
MVSFKKIALLGVASTLFSTVCGIPVTGSNVEESALSARVAGAIENTAPERRAPEAPTVLSTRISTARSVDSGSDDDGLTKRDIRMRLWWAQGGQIVFMLGRTVNNLPLPQELRNIVAGHMEGTPGQMLFRNFMNWVESHHADVHEWLTEQLPEVGAQMGGLWGTGVRNGDYGFAINIPGGWTNPGSGGAALLSATVHAIHEWAGSNVAEQQRANNFFNPADIGAGRPPGKMAKRSRTDECPAKDYNILRIANEEVPNDVDFKRYYRWAGECS